MKVIQATNVTHAYAQGIGLLKYYGTRSASRAGDVLKYGSPVTTMFINPMQRVLLDPNRVGNPVFHAMSAIWMLAGWRDATWLDQFIKDFSSRFAEKDGKLHGAYGYRWRHHFDLEGGGYPRTDQLAEAIKLLRADFTTRQIVLQMWDPVADLGTKVKDRPCNLCVCFNYRNDVLDMTVYNRSNDIIWGLYGENHVQFSVLHEYVCAMTGLPIGIYYHVSNDYHAYCDVIDKLPTPQMYYDNPYEAGVITPTPWISSPESFDYETHQFMDGMYGWDYNNYIFPHLLIPMITKEYDKIDASDWKLAVNRWRNK